jgi:hypothetical protein
MKIGNSIVIGLISLLFVTCVSDLPFDVEDTDIPVVNCFLTIDTIQTLSLTRSVKITDSYVFKEIKEAQVTLSANGIVVGEFEWKSYGNWQLNYRPAPGTEYQLLVQLPDGTNMTATTTMPRVNFFDYEDEKDHYPSKHFRQRTADAPCWVFLLSESELPPNLMHPVPSNKARLKTDLGTDHPWVDRFNENGNMYDLEPQVNVPSYSYYIHIPPFSIPKEGIPFCLQTNYGPYTFIYFRAASAEYDRYLKSSIQKLFVYRDENDPIQWFDENKVFSNVVNGTGIFAAYNDYYYFYFDDSSFFY